MMISRMMILESIDDDDTYYDNYSHDVHRDKQMIMMMDSTKRLYRMKLNEDCVKLSYTL